MVIPHQKYQLLIAEDEEALREILCELFTPYFQVLAAECGEEALEIAAREQIHLALFDVQMKLISGIIALKHLVQIHEHTPCILMTANYSEQLCKDAAEAFTVLEKPVHRATLLQTAASAMAATYHDYEFTERLLSY